jgi:hypothetical protein
MAPPSTQTIKVATNALREEAGTWDTESARMGEIGAKADGLRLTRTEAGLFQVIFDAYGQVLDQIIARSNEGAQRMTDVGNTLRSVANTYDEEEAAHEHKIKNLY